MIIFTSSAQRAAFDNYVTVLRNANKAQALRHKYSEDRDLYEALSRLGGYDNEYAKAAHQRLSEFVEARCLSDVTDAAHIEAAREG